MPVPFSSGEIITLRRYRPLIINGVRQTDSYGKLVMQSYDQVIPGAAIWPSSTSETRQGQERSRNAYLLVLPQSVVVDAIDRVVWRGLEYDVEGDPEMFQSPFTGSSLQQLSIVRVEG